MIQSQYDNFLRKNDITQTIIKEFFEDTLRKEENSLKYIDHVRGFCSLYDLRTTSADPYEFQFMRSLLIALMAWRTMNGYRGNKTVFDEFLPEPGAFAIQESWRHRDNQEREFRYRSEKRRGFYRNGEPTQTCGEDLMVQM
jgi:hypothetical protein